MTLTTPVVAPSTSRIRGVLSRGLDTRTWYMILLSVAGIGALWPRWPRVDPGPDPGRTHRDDLTVRER
jgi:hypothetical protein